MFNIPETKGPFVLVASFNTCTNIDSPIVGFFFIEGQFSIRKKAFLAIPISKNMPFNVGDTFFTTPLYTLPTKLDSSTRSISKSVSIPSVITAIIISSGKQSNKICFITPPFKHE